MSKSIRKLFLLVCWVLIGILLVGIIACVPDQTKSDKKSIVVTYSILGAIVKDLVGDQADVKISIPNGLNPHEWEPSPRDIEAIYNADLVIQNGLGLEDGLQKTLDQAQARGVKFFTVADHINVRHIGPGEGIPNGDPDQAIGAADPHLWLDPLTVKSFVPNLVLCLQTILELDVAEQAQDLQDRLDSLDQQIRDKVTTLSTSQRKLVTGHESLGYFAQRYEFKLVGAVIPSLSDQASVSAANIAALKQSMLDNQVQTIFTELGTSNAVVNNISAETGAKVVRLNTHILRGSTNHAGCAGNSNDGSYFTFMHELADTIVSALK